MQVSDRVEKDFGYAEMQVASVPDVYAGKICAAHDRQHPRDLYDVKFLFDNEGLTEDLRKTFLIFLISHQGPMAELLNPHLKDISDTYAAEFIQMTEVEVPLKELEAVRVRLVNEINDQMTDDEKRFLLSFKSRTPGLVDWRIGNYLAWLTSTKSLLCLLSAGR